MRKIIFALMLFISSCSSSTQAVVEVTPTFIIPSPTQTLAPTVAPTFTPIPPSPTATPIPCDPLTVDFCISDGNFFLQSPLQVSMLDSLSRSYAYGSTDLGKRDPHHGLDFNIAHGSPVLAAADGTIIFAGSELTATHSKWGDFYGNFVVISHANDLFTLYGHLSKINVAVDQHVNAGDVIGEVGDTGVAIGPHLHLEVRRGNNGEDYFSTENPELWLIPLEGTGALSITLKNNVDENIELPLVISYYPTSFTYYISSYAKTFEYNSEDAVLSNLPAGQYKVAFTDVFGLHERTILIEAGKLTEVVFDNQ